MYLLAPILLVSPLTFSSDDVEEPPPSWLGGRLATTQAADGLAFGYPVADLSAGERRAFAVGNALFKENWITAPASASGRDGLGPLFNARSCSSCHLRDGRGRPPYAGEEFLPGLLLRLGVRPEQGQGPDLPHPSLGGQLQDRAVAGERAEAEISIQYERVPGTYADGQSYELERPIYTLERAGYELKPAPLVGPRVAPQIIGLGLLEAVPQEALLALADPEDQDGDGISGRPAWVESVRTGQRTLGRFGWKATQPDVEQQVAAAFVNDIGITSHLFPEEAVTTVQAAVIAAPSGGNPELSEKQLDRVTFYSQVLAVPAQRNREAVTQGAQLFRALRCDACHTPEWTTGPHEVAAFANQTIRPFTDLLLHDLGPELADEKTDGDASPQEWRTPPLWGIGLFQAVNGHTRYLHDGRARNLEEAILWHGGEASSSRDAFKELEERQREALLAFLSSL